MNAATAMLTRPLTTIPSGLLTKTYMCEYPRGSRSCRPVVYSLRPFAPLSVRTPGPAISTRYRVRLTRRRAAAPERRALRVADARQHRVGQPVGGLAQAAEVR